MSAGEMPLFDTYQVRDRFAAIAAVGLGSLLTAEVQVPLYEIRQGERALLESAFAPESLREVEQRVRNDFYGTMHE